jgi:hypothetical protein
MHSPYDEIVLESEGVPLPSIELLCLESTYEARFGYISVIPLFYVQLSKEKGNIELARTPSLEGCVFGFTLWLLYCTEVRVVNTVHVLI